MKKKIFLMLMICVIPFALAEGFFIQNDAGEDVAKFYYNGDIWLNGACQIQGTCSNNNVLYEFVSSGQVIGYVDTDGNLCVEDGTCDGGQSGCGEGTLDAFLVQDSEGLTTISIDPTDGLCFSGALTENGQICVDNDDCDMFFPMCVEGVCTNCNDLCESLGYIGTSTISEGCDLFPWCVDDGFGDGICMYDCYDTGYETDGAPCTCHHVNHTCPCSPSRGDGAQGCSDSGCGCPEGWSNCLGLCKDTNADPDNCGSCGNTCSEGQTCVDGICQADPNAVCMDQSQTNIDGGYWGGNPFGQSFTPSVSASLAYFEFCENPNNLPIEAELREGEDIDGILVDQVSNGVNTGIDCTGGGVGRWIRFTFPTNPMLTAEQTYTVKLTDVSQPTYAISYSSGDNYPRGSAIFGGSFSNNRDVVFREYYQCAPVCTSGETRLCPNQQGVCSGSQETCDVNGQWPGCDDTTYQAHSNDYETTENCSDTLDNDCDGLIDDADPGCAGESHAEGNCDDGEDNDDDGETDYDDQDGVHGDDGCDIEITGISLSQNEINPGEAIDITCGVSPAAPDSGYNSIIAYIDENNDGAYNTGDVLLGGGGDDTWSVDMNSYLFVSEEIQCQRGETVQIGCSMDKTKSYQQGTDKFETLQCIDILKYSYDGQYKGTCPNEEQCFVKPEGDPTHNNDISAFYSTEGPTHWPKCITDGQYYKDNLCDNGNWTSRTKKVAMQLYDKASSNYEDDYILFCDLYENALNYYDYNLADGNSLKNFYFSANSCTQAGCFYKFCVLTDKVGNIRAVGGAINAQATDPLDMGELYKILNITGVCASDSGNEDLDACNPESLWYDYSTDVFVYGFEDGANINLGGSLSWDTLFNWIEDIFSQIFGWVNPQPGESALQFLEKAQRFDRIYLSKQYGREIHARQESTFLDDGTYTNKIQGSYAGFKTNLCNMVNVFEEGSCDFDPDTAIIYINSTKNGPAEGGIFDHWKSYTAELRLREGSFDAPVCGNGIVEFPEECDDGNTNNNDGCTNECRENVCGDGNKWEGVEECDDGDGDTADDCPDAPGGCEPAYCGDGFVRDGVEECDDGNIYDNDGCSGCIMVEDPNNPDPNSCYNSGCQKPNTCNDKCVLDIGCNGGLDCTEVGTELKCRNPSCDASPDCVCPVCGNGVVDQGESCDDGNQISCDGCSPDCSRSDDVCGDGIVECGEECDGTNLNGETCSSQGFGEGNLVCTPSCNFDLTGCYNP